MNNEQQQIIDEAYENYVNNFEKEWIKRYDPMLGDFNHEGRPMTQKEFIDKCKTDQDFSEKWELKIEERELSLEERATIWNNTHNPAGNIFTHNQYDENNIPKRAISLRYNHKTITSYE